MRTRVRHIEITLGEEVTDEEVEAFFDRAIEACGCEDPEGKDCVLLTAGIRTHYYDDDDGIPFDKPEGGLPVYTHDLDDHLDTEICGATYSIEATYGRNWITTCLQPPGHESPHSGPITW